jgi:probable HAF family extracellular repeat protein
MPSTARTIGRVSGRLRLAAAGAAVATALTTATAAAAVMPPVPTPAPQASRPDPNTASTAAVGASRTGLSPKAPTGPRSQYPVFVLKNGRFTGFDAPGPVANDNLVKINNRGEIAGGYIQDYAEDSTGMTLQGRSRGFLRDRRGRTTRIDVPGAAGTTPFDLNDAGTVVGIYSDHPLHRTDKVRSFLRDRRGRYTTIGVPGATQTQARGINNRGQVVGEYRDANGAYHGFLWDKGRVVTIDRGPAGATLCTFFDVNDRGQLVGLYVNAAGALQGCLLDRGRAVTIAAPGVAMTFSVGINNRGQIVGLTTAGPGQPARGFLLRDGAGGRFTPVDVPGTPDSAATGINDAGTIVGVYANPAFTPTPPPTSTQPSMGRRT